jgi:hypothetical protein
MSILLDAKAEFDEERDAVVRQLEGICFSWDQNGHLSMLRDDINTLAMAIDLLKRAQMKSYS